MAAEVIRSSAPLVKGSFRAVREDGEKDYELKDGNRVFGSIVQLDDGLSVRCTIGGARYIFATNSAKEAVDALACYVFLPKVISDASKTLADLRTYGIRKWSLESLMNSGLDMDLLCEQLIRNNTKNLTVLQSRFEEASVTLLGSGK